MWLTGPLARRRLVCFGYVFTTFFTSVILNLVGPFFLPFLPFALRNQKRINFIQYVRKDKKVKHDAKNYKIHQKHLQITYVKEIRENN
jgi:hypothetical protein